MGSPPNVEQNITQIPLRGVEKYRWFYESRLGEILQDYRKGKLKKDEASEAIASVCAGKESYQLFHVVDIWHQGDRIDRRIFRSDTTLRKLLNEARRHGWAVLHRGLFAIPRAVWSEYKERYEECEETWERAKRGETYIDKEGKERRWQGLRLWHLFREERLTRMAPYILADTDQKQGMTFEKLKRLVKYLHSLGIYPEVWESASGEGNYHIYIHLVGMVKKWVEKAEDGTEKEHRRYYLPYASDYRVSLVVEGLKKLFQHLGIPYDSISEKKAVWLEGFPNPEKGGKASRKIWGGKVHRLDKLTEKLRPFWEKSLREEAKKEYFSFQLKKSAPVGVGSAEIPEKGIGASNPFDFLAEQRSTASRMLDRGYTWAQIEDELREAWGGGDWKAWDRTFRKFKDYIEAHHRPLPQKPRTRAKPKEKRRHRHYWEHVPAIAEVLREDGLDSSLNHIHRRTGIPKGTLSYIFRIVSREQILYSPEEAQELLKSYQKGGDRMTEEQKEEARERGKERWKDYLERFLEESLKKRRKSLGEKEEKPLSFRAEGFSTLTGVQIGHISIASWKNKEGDGITQYHETFTFPENANNAEPPDRSEPTATAEDHGPVDIFRKVEGVPEELVKKHLEGKEPKPRYDRRDPLELALMRRAWELIEKVETRWDLELGEVPEGDYKRLIFGAVRRRNGKKRTYDLGGWGRFAFALGEVLEELGYEVIYPKTREELEDEAFGEWAQGQLGEELPEWETPEVDEDLLDF